MCLIVGLFVLAVIMALFFVFALVGTTIALLPWIIVGLIAGWLASAITKSRHGALGDIAIGLAGSIIGGVLYVALVHRSVGGAFSPTRLVVATIGAIILLLVVKAVHARSY